jgi:hypothetical protein
MPIVKMPNGETIRFPDNMPETEMANAVMLYSKKFAPVEPTLSMPEAETQGGVQQPQKRDILTGDMPALVGGVIGGLAQTARQRIPAAGILAGGGEAYHQLYQRYTGDPNAPQTSEEAARRIGLLGGEQAIGQGAGELIMRGLSKVLPHVKEKFMVPDRTGAEETLRNYMEPTLNKGISERVSDKIFNFLPESLQYERYAKPGFTVAQKADPLSGAHRMEQIVESSFFGAKPIKEFKFAQQKGLEQWADDASQQVWAGIEKVPPSQRGQKFVEGFDKAEDVFRQGVKQKYSQVDNILGDVTVDNSVRKTSTILDSSGKPFTYDVTETSNKIVDLTEFKKWVAKESSENAKFVGIGGAQSGDTLISKATNLPDKFSFADAAELRSRLIKEGVGVEGKPVAHAVMAKVTSRIDSAMEQAAKSVGGDAEKAWRKANAFYKKGKKTFDNEFISNLIERGREQPELVGKGLFQNGEISQIKMAKNALKGSPQTFQAMKAGWLEDVFNASKKDDGSLVGKTFFNKLKGMGDETLKEIFTGPELALIRKFEEASTRTQKLGSAGGGSILIQLMQAGAIGGAITGAWFKDPDIVAGGVTILLAPKVLAHMLVNPKYHNLFYRGLSTERPIYTPAITRLAAESVKINNELKEKEIQGIK